MTAIKWWKCGALAAASLALGACALGESDVQDQTGDEDVAEVEQDATAGCTMVRLTAPSPGFIASVGVPIALTGLATCPVGVTPEYQYWAKPQGAPNWSILGPYVPGSSSWAIPWVGNWSISVVARGVGSTQSYQARSGGVTGSAIHVNLPPTANLDGITTTINLPGAADVLANDSDPDGDPLTLTVHTDPSHGTVSFAGSLATYTPGAGYLGTDSFTYTVIDGQGGTSVGTVEVSVIDQAPSAVDDVLISLVNASGTVNVLANDSDADGDPLTLTAFTQGAHGAVGFSGGVATYTPATGYAGADSFTYTIDDGHGMTATATVNVTVTSPVAGCTISIAGPASGVYGQNLHLVANAVCNTGAAQVQWYHRIGSSYVMVQAWSTTLTLDYTADGVGSSLFYALVRTQGTTASQGTSKTLAIPVADNTPQCTSVKVTAPTSGQTVNVGMAQTLTGAAVCPVGAVAEYQFWVKRSTTSIWTVLAGYTTTSSSWTPPATGTWNVKVVARSVGSHVNYQTASGSVSVTAAP